MGARPYHSQGLATVGELIGGELESAELIGATDQFARSSSLHG